jgi:hypothetical protein
MPILRRRRVDRVVPLPVLNRALFLIGSLLVLIPALALRARGQVPDAPARQVTLFGVIASPFDPRIDPKLAKIAPQLRKLLPGHGFRLLDVQSKRLTASQSVTCNLEDGFTAAATLIQPVDENGKVRLRCAVLQKEVVALESLVTTPANQLFFCDKLLPNATRMLIGIGAR